MVLNKIIHDELSIGCIPFGEFSSLLQFADWIGKSKKRMQATSAVFCSHIAIDTPLAPHSCDQFSSLFRIKAARYAVITEKTGKFRTLFIRSPRIRHLSSSECHYIFAELRSWQEFHWQLMNDCLTFRKKSFSSRKVQIYLWYGQRKYWKNYLKTASPRELKFLMLQWVFALNVWCSTRGIIFSQGHQIIGWYFATYALSSANEKFVVAPASLVMRDYFKKILNRIAQHKPFTLLQAAQSLSPLLVEKLNQSSIVESG